VLADSSNGIVQAMHDMTLATVLPTVDTILSKVKSAAPDLKQEQIVNGLTVAYCPILAADDRVRPGSKSWQLGNFSARVYTQLITHGAY